MLFGNLGKSKTRARALLVAVGLEDRMHHRLSELSGGQQQRVAIAISLANDPDLLLADEPTGEVDTQTAGQIYDIFRYLNREHGLTIVIVSHDRNIAQQVDRVVAIRDGRTSTETVRRVSVHEGEEHTLDEFVIVDDTGRLQVPREMLARLDITGRALVDIEGDRIVIRSDSADPQTVVSDSSGLTVPPIDSGDSGVALEGSPDRPPQLEQSDPLASDQADQTLKRVSPEFESRDVPEEHRRFAPRGSEDTPDA
tara:strand:- start:398 stop:1159 length:762 start_codon:yes stop_codon:yes gene_type:complete